MLYTHTYTCMFLCLYNFSLLYPCTASTMYMYLLPDYCPHDLDMLSMKKEAGQYDEKSVWHGQTNWTGSAGHVSPVHMSLLHAHICNIHNECIHYTCHIVMYIIVSRHVPWFKTTVTFLYSRLWQHVIVRYILSV